jgi:hypothetical protein
MFTDKIRTEVCDDIRQRDVRAFSKQLTPAVFAEAAKRTGVTLVQSPLYLVNLVWLGVAAAWHGGEQFAGILTATLELLEDQETFYQTKAGKAKRAARRRAARSRGRGKKHSKHDPRRGDPTQVSEEAFTQARQRMPLKFWINLIIILGENFHAEHADLHQFRGFRILAMDGTRLNLPDRRALKRHFGTARNKSGDHNAQARMVLLQFPFTRLPYRYELAPLRDGEVTIALRQVAHLQRGDLVLMDAGYLSYQLLWAIANQHAFFAIPARRKLNLKTIRRLQPDGRDSLVRWTPKDSRRRWHKLGLPPSMDLRLIRYRVPGFRAQEFFTNVLDPEKISRDDWTRLTTDCQDAGRKLLPGLFHRRWEIETTFDELKVHQGLDRNLRSRTPKSIQYEVAGHVVLYLLIRWLMVEAAIRYGLDPLRLSFLEAKRELDKMRPSLAHASPWWAAHVLVPRLLSRIAGHQVPFRPGRHYPRRKKRRNKARKRAHTTCKKPNRTSCKKATRNTCTKTKIMPCRKVNGNTRKKRGTTSRSKLKHKA